MEMPKFGALLLVLGGALHTLPVLSEQLSSLVGGTLLLQILIGVTSIITGTLFLLKQLSVNA